MCGVKTWGTDPTKGPFFKGFAFLPAGSAHGTIASSLAISFASRVAKEGYVATGQAVFVRESKPQNIRLLLPSG